MHVCSFGFYPHPPTVTDTKFTNKRGCYTYDSSNRL